jgi:tRNA-specific 2-thiouridylase
MKRVALGMSGGVDSSVSAALLKEQGYDVTGVFLECWRAPGCRAEEDRKDALAVALQLGIPFEVLDFKDTYKEKIVEYFFREYKAGRTPNPDVLCNKEIKFGLFYDWAMEHGFDAVATGHYAQIVDGSLIRGIDEKKDQTYFLYLLRKEQLEHILFPIGHLKKMEVRKLAKKYKLPVADKPDSQGICFIGEIDVRGFLRDRLGEKPGEVVTIDGEVIGEHKGLWFYTIGQRHGFTLNAKARTAHGEWKHVIPPFYVVKKVAEKNQLVVGFGEETLHDSFVLEKPHWIEKPPADGKRLHVRIRHGGKLISAVLLQKDEHWSVQLNERIQGIAEGQSGVVYDGEVCLGGGVIQ